MKPLRMLLLSFHYPPDISAGAFRAEALVKALGGKLPAGSELEILTTVPNRYVSHVYKASSTSGALHDVEERDLEGKQPNGWVRIIRFALPAGAKGDGGMAAQARMFLHYAYRVMRHTWHRRYDVVFATSSKLMTAVLGRWVARRCGARLYQDIRDIFVENLPHVLPLGVGHLLAPLFSGLERWALGHAGRINVVSPGFLPYFSVRYPRHVLRHYTNGVDKIFVDAARNAERIDTERACGGRVERLKERSRQQEGPVKIVYAGNVGVGQGLERILPDLAVRLAGRAEFRLIGDGGGLKSLERALASRGIDNVALSRPMSRRQLLDAYRQADILFLHLNDIPSFVRVLPSKLFEYAATGKPIWAGATGYAATFIAEEVGNAAIFPPCDIEGAIAAFERLEVHSTPRLSFIDAWRRDRIMDEMSSDVMALVGAE